MRDFFSSWKCPAVLTVMSAINVGLAKTIPSLVCYIICTGCWSAVTYLRYKRENQ